MSTTPELREPRSRSKIMSAIGLVIAVLATMVTFSASPASATESADECYVEEAKYEREIPKQKYQKYTSTREKDDGEWGAWSSWTPYGSYQWVVGFDPPQYVNSGGNEISAAGVYHGHGNGWQRNYRYQAISAPTGSGQYQTTEWLTEPPAGDGWEVKDTKKGETFPCPDASATPGSCEAPGVITPSESDHYESEIDGDTVTFTANPPAVFGGDVQIEFSFPEIEQLSGEECDEDVTPVAPTVNQSEECEVEGTLVVPSTPGVTYLLGEDDVTGETLTGPISGTLTAEAEDGYVLTDAEWSFEVNLAAAEDCPPPPPPPPPPGDPEFSVGAITAVCPSAPFLDYTIDSDFDGTLTITFVNPDGDDIVRSGLATSGRILFPGAELDSSGEATAWPGWMQNPDGSWSVGGDFAWVLDGVNVQFEQDGQSAVQFLEYPVVNPADCGPDIPEEVGGIGSEIEPEVGGIEAEPGPQSLPRTGADPTALVFVAVSLAVLGATLVAVERRGFQIAGRRQS